MNAFKLVSILAAASAAACTTVPAKPIAPPPEVKAVEVVADPKPSPQLPAAFTQKGVTVKVDSLWQQADGEILGVSGTAKNVTASDLRFCQISLAFLDQGGAKLDDAKVSTKSLKSGQVWHFQAALTHPSQASYASVTADKVVAIPVRPPQGDLANLK